MRLNLKKRVEQLEAAATPDGHCPHLPPIVRAFTPSGQEVDFRGEWEKQNQPAPIGPDVVCSCGRERLAIQIQYVDKSEDAALSPVDGGLL